jgi:hypothetical protein
MTVYRTTVGFCLAAIVSLALAPTAFAGPTGDEYLPQLPQSGASGQPGANGSSTGTTTLGDSSGASGKSGSKDDESTEKAIAPVSGSGGSGGDSGSILLNPIVLLMIAAVIAAAVGATLWRRRADDAEEVEGESASQAESERPRRGGAPTPDGEIIGPDQAG